jgi:NADH dehydrogenase FAD-containing subunit
MSLSNQRPIVVVVGGGYGGVNVAKALDDVADVTLVEPKEDFFHNVAALRGLVDPSWLDRIFISYNGLLQHGRVVRARAERVDDLQVTLDNGEVISADFVVLASGSSYPFPAKSDAQWTKDAHDQFRAAHASLSEATRVLLLGAGPVGIELAGEIHAVWPEKAVTIVDVANELLGGRFAPELRAELARQLHEIGVEVLLGSPLRSAPPTPPGALQRFTVVTEQGQELTADIWFRCYGVVPVSDYLRGALADARTAEGFISVTEYLQVVGHEAVFALGDVSDADAKMAGFAGFQAAIVATNIKALIAGENELTPYASVGPAIAVPIGPEGGAGQFPGQEGIVGPEVVAQVKGREMMVDRFAELLGAPMPT